MTDEQFSQASRSIALTVMEAMAAIGASAEDAAAVAGAAALETLAQLMGGPAAIERLRSIADVAEAQLMASNPQPAGTWH